MILPIYEVSDLIESLSFANAVFTNEIVIFLAKKLTDFKPVHTFFERFGDKIQVIIYIVLGLYVMFDAGTIQYLISLL